MGHTEQKYAGFGKDPQKYNDPKSFIISVNLCWTGPRSTIALLACKEVLSEIICRPRNKKARSGQGFKKKKLRSKPKFSLHPYAVGRS